MQRTNSDHEFNPFLFKSPEGQALYFEAYDAVFSSFGLKPEEIQVATRFGLTHVNAFGPKGAPALMLLHGMGASSTMWAPNIQDLRRDFRVYAPDTIDDLGKSRCEKRLRRRTDYIAWLTDLCSGLKLGKTHLAGVSYGGWLAFLFASSTTPILDKIIGIAPAATFQRISPKYFIKAIPVVLTPIKRIKDHFFVRFFSWLAGMTDLKDLERHLLWRQQVCGADNARLRPIVPPRVLSDRELQSIKLPSLLLLGTREVIYDPLKVLYRAEGTMLTITAELISGGTHMMSWDKSAMINARMIAFLKESCIVG
jgi:pimeloyl-ACP methyl ester carboxylesterase